ncbi:STAS domain-containing protein [Modestobacter roseus]|uniref:Anti-anti-sigma factor n=1 Tax=Modestobacter roseus TaxID=1181884 RepID=A0A562IME3_9ACTN|nr:STAS domain-containing protein [Modestobacter roseus]TWH72181.1 anti-anti-sigma factor [Modestobacter roseus]
MSELSVISIHAGDSQVIEIQEHLVGPGQAVLTVAGEVDQGTCALLRAVLLRTWDTSPTAVVVDLRQVTFLNAGGLRALLLASRTARLRGVPLVLQVERGLVARLLDVVGLGELALTPEGLRAVLQETAPGPPPVLSLVPAWRGRSRTPPVPDLVGQPPGSSRRPDLRLVPAPGRLRSARTDRAQPARSDGG